MRSPEISEEERVALQKLEARVGRVHLRQRLGMEQDHEAQVIRAGTHFFHLENWYSAHGLIRGTLRLVGLHERGRRNTLAIQVRCHDVPLANLEPPFDGFTILHLSDLHVDISEGFLDALIRRVAPLDYDLCVLTGDYRARTFGRFDAVLGGLKRLREHLKGPAYAVLGNHDTIRLVPAMEAMGYGLLLNEHRKIERGNAAIYLIGIDDAHYYRAENFHRAVGEVPERATSILLSHTPEVYRRAAHSGISLMLCGHTHGGQICLPGGRPIITDADCPRSFARGSWRYNGMIGYTSVGAGTSIVDVRLNCPPEITLHRLQAHAA